MNKQLDNKLNPELEPKPLESKPKLRLDVMIIFISTTLVALTVVPWYGFTTGYSLGMWVTFVLFMLWNGLSITAGYHRLWSHKTYKAHPMVRVLFAIGGTLAVQNSIRVWCADHRHHHRYTDHVDKDPYSAQRGFWYSHMGWMLRDYQAAEKDFSNIKDLDKDPIVVWQDKHYALLALAANFLLTTFIGALLGDALGGLLLLGFLRLVLSHHTTFLINSLAHFWGRQPYSDMNSSKDNPIIAFFTYGEGYHNYHHTFQWDYRNGIFWYQYDPTKWLIKVLSWCSLTSDLKRIAPEIIEQSIASMQLKKAKAEISKLKSSHNQLWLEILEAEYDQLVEALNEWSTYRHHWIELKRKTILKKWEETETRHKLKELEAALDIQRQQWKMLTQQFA
ncbi:MAG: stearoyl-CoA desaturase (delta-9 desaturase) [Candidatus Azotimanducaceae bacterium]|jgi:stearoyl-CoA desaturase (delta-9 desaturase)